MFGAQPSCEGHCVASGTQRILFCYGAKLDLKCTEEHLLEWLLGLAEGTSAGCSGRWWRLPPGLRALWGSGATVASLAFGRGPRVPGRRRGSTEPARWAQNTSSWLSVSGRNPLISCPWCTARLQREKHIQEVLTAILVSE